ncbi:GGDEF domain-containing protein [Listeria monocytogenes]|uniref:GGDEF domain-containing protein n=1 Tax=Listeria monocytogenes TaxID=1639 RepID=UPI00057C7527|nr:GGDEF domain-containing protein [Listeria monocytogenes]EAC2321393.1 GGDEF domain-containing protein [Listeria monocytogenes]EAC3860461.1 GGDEF domain-containing protein [Listeria monocytogenes]EAC5420277.1 GGDEF domain-containing protein [Listeria monocytogenes]EAC5447152.1 GGDEF domain-containing protein [Listeria monocytogenes]EAC9299389.1 GGDEF domain-containing protein [Listeria monocytogenes]
MPNILDSLWNSMALFLSALFFHGMALRSIREKKPAWFQIKFANEFINYALGIYYGLLGVYFIIRGLPVTDSGIYTDMLLNILIVLHLFSSAGPATIALLLIVSGKLFLGDALFANLIYVFLIIGFHFVCMEVAKLRLSSVQKVVLVKLSAIPLMLFYLHQKIHLAYTMNDLPVWILYFLVSFFITFIIVSAAYYIDTSNKLIYDLQQSTILDPLTGLTNFRHFENAFDAAFNHATLKKSNLSVIIIDIDYFKRVNDTYGHLVGNGVLSTFSQMLLKISFPPNTVISRIGGEEFAIILPNINVSETEHLAEKIRRKVEKIDVPIVASGSVITISAGIANYDGRNYPSANELLNAADQALYNAKRNGRNQVHIRETEPVI